MQSSLRVVTSIPLAELWDDEGNLPHRRVRGLGAVEIRALMRNGPVRFAIANVGEPLAWVPLPDCSKFFKGEVRSHLAEPEQQIVLDKFPDGYCYFASDWSRDGASWLILLERHH